MKKQLPIVLAILVATVLPCLAQTQNQPAPDPASKLIQFQMALIKRGPKWTPHSGTDVPPVLKQHVDYAQSLLKSGKAVIAGPIKDDKELLGIYIFRTKLADEAREWLKGDPIIGTEFAVAELHPWWSEDVMKKTETPDKLMTAYLAFLVRGEKWTPEKTPQTAEIQKGHMANIQRLAEMKKLVVAGPFGDDGRLRGIFVFRVDSMKEARTLTLTDPAVQAGRLALELHPWVVPEGILP
jgi:uncharacterized protein YciI